MNSSSNGSLATAMSDGDGQVSLDTQPYNVMSEPDSDRHLNAASQPNVLGLANVVELSTNTSKAIIPPAA